jgi:hypothetical protein
VRMLRKRSLPPDGSKTLFTTQLESEIWVMGSNAEELRKIPNGSQQDAFGYLAWFPDGKRILFLRYPLVGPNAVESLALDGAQPAICSLRSQPPSFSIFYATNACSMAVGDRPATTMQLVSGKFAWI